MTQKQVDIKKRHAGCWYGPTKENGQSNNRHARRADASRARRGLPVEAYIQIRNMMTNAEDS